MVPQNGLRIQPVRRPDESPESTGLRLGYPGVVMIDYSYHGYNSTQVDSGASGGLFGASVLLDHLDVLLARPPFVTPDTVGGEA